MLEAIASFEAVVRCDIFDLAHWFHKPVRSRATLNFLMVEGCRASEHRAPGSASMAVRNSLCRACRVLFWVNVLLWSHGSLTFAGDKGACTDEGNVAEFSMCFEVQAQILFRMVQSN